MLLGASSDAVDTRPNLTAAVDGSDAGVPHSQELTDFAEAVWRRDDSLDPARASLDAAVGSEGVVEAALTVAVFRSLNIGADASGIPLDDFFASVAEGFVDDLGLRAFPTAANSPALS